MRALRECQRLSIREFALRIGVSERMVSRWEAGGEQIRPRPINQAGLDSLLAAASDAERSRFAARLKGPEAPSAPPSEPVRAATPPSRFDHSGSRSRAAILMDSGHDQSSDVFAMQSFRTADRQVGGGHLYSSVVKYLHVQVGPRLFGGDLIIEDPAVFTAAAGLTEMAGWMAHDAGRDDRAYSHFLRAFHLSKAGKDRQLGVHILASLSHLAHHRADSNGAVRFAQAGQRALAQGPANPELSARLLAMQARGHAAEGNAGETHNLLAKAENALDGTHQETPSPWVSRFDLGSLSSEAARCTRQLGKHNEAAGHAERIIALRTSSRTRSHAFGQLFLIATLIDQGEPAEACRLVREVVDATQSVGSHLIVQQFRDIREQLTQYADSPAVRETRQSLAETIRQRVWLQQWITSDASSPQVTRG
ncbi:helix-turn-helix transcriptional regulator [Kribbella sp. NPDC006257]|uniref:helix-turn-helix domain-containing protein n=1 Tax=Kribbella sp. NPDC006257 TaxID=3156738 RepID=UPI0033BF59C1